VTLQELIYGTRIRQVIGDLSRDITSVCIDSRKAKPGSVFIAIRGFASDGHQFIDSAISNGAVAVVAEKIPGTTNPAVVYIQVENSAAAAGIISNQFFGNPSRKMTVVGVTGTNGKTTVATLLYKLFTALGYDCGLISTVQNIVGNTVLEATHTTPDPVNLSELFDRMVREGCTLAFMEVSSHAIHQHRIEGLHFAGGIFTNITHDHLDYHKDFNEYIRVKKSFFDGLDNTSFALTNLDDKRGEVMLQNTSASKKNYSLRSMSDFKGRILDDSLMGLHMSIDEQDVHFRLIGEFNAYNLLAVYGAAILLGEDKHEVLRALSLLTGAAGRFDWMVSLREKISAVIDYAHTPDAVRNVLATINKLRKGTEQVITVIGCGGDRDRTKRPVMAEVACTLSDRVIFTSDNPRFEEPEAIIHEMEAGVPPASGRKFISITDRREAIKTAIHMAGPGDILLIAGKGHEHYQEIKGVRKHFDDREVVSEFFELLNK